MQLARLIFSLTLLATFPAAQAATLQEINQLYKKGKSEQALVELDAYLASLPKDTWGRNVTQARFLRGIILTEQKRTDEAIRVFSRLTLDYPDLPEPYNNLAAIYVAQSKYDMARETLERAMRIDPAYATLQANLSDVYAKLSTQAYESTLRTSSSKGAPERLREVCENYGKMANQSAGRKIAARADADFRLLQDIHPSRTAAAQPPAHVDIDEMAMESPEPVKPAAVAAKPASAPPALSKPEKAEEAMPESSSAEDKQAILKALQGWGNAWSAKNVNGYLSYYAQDFKLPGGGTRAAWATQRRERISKPKSIRVTVESPQITSIDSTHARVTFKQSYRSDALQTTGRKTMLMIKTGGKWLIQEERVGG